MPSTRLYITEKLLQDQLKNPSIDSKSRANAIAGLAEITVAKIKLRTLRERSRAKAAAQKATTQKKSFGLD
jgi:hypothetical protein